MSIIWPTSLPEYCLEDGFQEHGPELVVRTSMDTGPDKVRRRFTGDRRFINAPFRLTWAQTQTLDDFYMTTLNGGAERFEWVHPRTGATKEFRFLGRPSYTPESNYWRTVLQLEVMP